MTPEQIAEATVESFESDDRMSVNPHDLTYTFGYPLLKDMLTAAIEADRAQRTWQVLAGGTSRYPLAIIGAYATKFEAEAVADAWNRVNGQYGIRYRVEEDA